jgi:Helix-turn-helix
LRWEAAAFLARSQTESVSARSLVQDSGAQFWSLRIAPGSRLLGRHSPTKKRVASFLLSNGGARSAVRTGVVDVGRYSFHMRTEELPMKPVLVRELIGESLREERVSQGKTLREVSRKARVSLGYLSEVERGQKEASSELLAAICAALDLPLSVVLSVVSEKMAVYEGVSALPSVRSMAQAAA